MPLYVHEVEASVAPPEGSGTGVGHGLRPEQFTALVDAVARELARRKRGADALRADAKLTGTNRPPSVGG
ncbi:MAG TPA: hypothetical protein VFE05_04635 [Longimicrobiaceae bacterium]|jgi:hypothetical protein|nr:hypothetical protein [Longimicrobiaceae bacterium]